MKSSGNCTFVKPNSFLVSVPASGKIKHDEFINRIQQAIAPQSLYHVEK
ncbi:MAG: hypothetical protein PUP91_23180 [Rhizonema sp. PD37]|nr:hypothetical protein [Rhizonema sp. PD37]